MQLGTPSDRSSKSDVPEYYKEEAMQTATSKNIGFTLFYKSNKFSKNPFKKESLVKCRDIVMLVIFPFLHYSYINSAVEYS